VTDLCNYCAVTQPLCLQASLIAEEVLRENADAERVLFNKFHPAINFKQMIPPPKKLLPNPTPPHPTPHDSYVCGTPPPSVAVLAGLSNRRGGVA
jgi:hypothetical protein